MRVHVGEIRASCGLMHVCRHMRAIGDFVKDAGQLYACSTSHSSHGYGSADQKHCQVRFSTYLAPSVLGTENVKLVVMLPSKGVPRTDFT